MIMEYLLMFPSDYFKNSLFSTILFVIHFGDNSCPLFLNRSGILHYVPLKRLHLLGCLLWNRRMFTERYVMSLFNKLLTGMRSGHFYL